VYVRRVNFSGTTSINDDVLRREMRQLEGAYLSNAAIDRSKIRLQRLPYLQDVDIKTQPVPGSNDLVDVDVSLKDGLPGQFGGGIGYSESQSFVLNASIVHANVLGTGERLALEVNGGRYSKVYDISTTNPYATLNGLSRTFSLSYHDVKQLTSTYSEFSTKTLIGGVEFSYPITELQALQFGASLQHAELATPASTSKQLTDWVRNNGNAFFEEVGSDTVRGTRFDVAELSLGWSWDSRDRTLFPTHGAAHRLQLRAGVPISTNPVEYLLATYDYQQYFRLSAVPLLKYVPFSLRTSLDYGTGLGGTTDVPPNRHFFTGGADSVRGFREYTLGPRDSLGNPYGGDAAFSGQFEAILPTPQKFANSARVTLFVDFGDSFFLGDTKFTDKGGYKTSYPFDLRELRASTGVGVEWLSPLGLFRLSWAYPLRYRHGTERRYGDEIEPLQFTFGKAF
jgi:outer membrane protein insertion porin family